MITAEVIEIDGSQAIRLPKAFHVSSDQVYLKRTADGFVVTEKDPWETFIEGVDEISDDFMKEGRCQPPLEDRLP